jgi:superfamily II DNA or RNA helicase
VYHSIVDEDTIVNVEDADVSLRDYQKELAEEGVKGTNVVIMAPTNSGKTRVACKITQV